MEHLTKFRTSILEISAALLLVFYIVSVAGCSNKFSEEPNQAEFNVSRDDIGKYKVVIEVPKDQSVSVIRTSRWTEEKTEIAVNRSGIIIDENPITGELYTYKVGSHIDEKFIESYEVDVLIPLEITSSAMRSIPKHYYEFSKNADGLSKLEIVTLVLDKGFPFAFNKSVAEINVRKLVSKDGILESHSTESVADYNEKGHEVGPLNLNIFSGEGDVQIILRGQSGGQPPTPAPLGEEGRGPKGSKGTDGIQHHVYHIQLDNTLVECSKIVGQGGKGGKGVTGLPGTKGMNGGDSPIMYLNISSAAEIAFTIDRQVGIGGKGGDGGEGGPGGFPGDSGDLKKSYHSVGDPKGNKYMIPRIRAKVATTGECKIPAQGEMGDKGDNGPPGLSGDPGRIEKYCIKDHNTNSWGCVK